MNLEEFISTSLSEIINAVSKTRANLTDKSARINPPVRFSHITGVSNAFMLPMNDSTNHSPISMIEFDVALTVNEGSTAGVGAKLDIKVASLGGQGQQENSESRMSRIKFSIPVQLPSEPA